MIERAEMQEIAKRYREPVELILGSHSALDARSGARNYGLRSIIYTTRGRAIIYLQNIIVGKPREELEDIPEICRRDVAVCEDPADLRRRKEWSLAILVLDRYDEILKYVDDLVELECVQVPNRAFSVYVGGDERCSLIEEKFAVPILGSRKLLKVENRGEIERDYYWFAEKAGIPTPRKYSYEVSGRGIRFREPVDEPMLLKAEHAKREFERVFIFAADSSDLEEKVEREVEAGNLGREQLENARVEQIVLGPHANFNFFYSPLNAGEEWGDVDDALARLHGLTIEQARKCLANELLSIDERRESILDGLTRMPLSVRKKIEEKTIPSFEVTLHSMVSMRESLLKDVLKCADALLLTLAEHEEPGIIGAWCLQTIITWDKASKYGYTPTTKLVYATTGDAARPEDYGLYDAPTQEVVMHIPVTQDVALRHGGGTNVHMGIGAQYANARYQRQMSTGDRIALEIRRATRKGRLAELVT